MPRIYRSVVHDGDTFEMERQVHLLAKAGAAVCKKYWELNKGINQDDPLLPELRELYQQLDKMDIFMGGFQTRLAE